jgi:F420-dependent oxidoreductase-like protein
MTPPVRFGVTLPQIKRTWEEARTAAQEFDALGYHSAWVCDHLYGVPVPQLPILEAWTQLAAVAAVTQRIELGTLVTPPFFRNPAVLAKQIATVDQIAGGRVIPGFGAGWFEAEFTGYGCEFPSIGDRMNALNEAVELMKRMWTEEEVTFDGRFAKAHAVRCEPKPPRRPPVLIGGGGEKVLMGIAARHADIWNNLAVFQPHLAQKVQAMRQRCDDAGRDFETLQVSQQCTVVIAPDEQTAGQFLEKAKKVYGGHMGGAIEEHGIWGTPDQVIERIQRHVDLGVSLFVIEFFGRDTREPARLFAEEVFPAFA